MRYLLAEFVFNDLRDRFGTQILLVILSLLILVPFYVAYRLNNQDQAALFTAPSA